MTIDERIDALTRFADDDMRTAFAGVMKERDHYRRRAHAAEHALSDLRTSFGRIEREWQAAAAEQQTPKEG